MPSHQYSWLFGIAKPTIILSFFLLVFVGCSEKKPDTTQQETLPQEIPTQDTVREVEPVKPDTLAGKVADSTTVIKKDSVTATIPINLADTVIADARARYLAGLAPRVIGNDTAKLGLRDSIFWKTHATKINNAWARFSGHRKQVWKWAKTELGEARKAPTVFYPFSGPDFAHVYTLFPDAKSYTMIGLEPVGNLPELENYSPELQRKAFKRLGNGLRFILSSSFFVTHDMDTVLQGKELKGTVPLLNFFMVRLGCKVLGFELLKLTPDGSLVLKEPNKKLQGNDAVRFTFRTADGEIKQLTYISGNLSDDGLNRINVGLKKYIQTIENPVTYLKSASYLLHYASFSSIRELILNQSSYVLQDDSGLPFVFLQAPKWQTLLYGNYTGTIRLFSHMNQENLKKAYLDSAKIKRERPLNFRLGYGKQQQINLQFSKRILP